MDYTLVHLDDAEPQLMADLAHFGQLLCASLDPGLTLNPTRNP